MSNKYKILIYSIVFLRTLQIGYSQISTCESIKNALTNRKCFQASIHVDKSTILDAQYKKSFFGDVSKEDKSAAYTIVAYPNGESHGAHNRLTIVAYAKSSGHQEFAFTYNGTTSIFYPDRIKSFNDSYGYHFELGRSSGNVLDQLLLNELIKIDVTERTCQNGEVQTNAKPSKPQVVYVEKPQSNPNEGCKDLQSTLTNVASKMYKWNEENKKSSWLTQTTKKLFDLPGGCIDREIEIEKIVQVASDIYPKWNEEDKKNIWIRKTIENSFTRPCTYSSKKLGAKIDAVVTESKEIFEWHQEDKKQAWLTKKIEEILK